MVTSSLNYRFQLLQEAGTCDEKLLQLLGLLVAHATREESEAKDNREDYAMSPATATSLPTAAGSSSGPCPSHCSVRLGETVKAVQERIVLTTEEALEQYACDVRQVNELAVAALERESREIELGSKKRVSDSVKAAADEASVNLLNAVEQRHEEKMLAAENDIQKLEARLRKLRETWEKNLQELDAYASFLCGAHESLVVKSLISSHELIGASSLLQEELAVFGEQCVKRWELKLMDERISQLEVNQLSRGNESALKAEKTALKSNFSVGSGTINRPFNSGRSEDVLLPDSHINKYRENRALGHFHSDTGSSVSLSHRERRGMKDEIEITSYTSKFSDRKKVRFGDL